jgi:hypothetical protein
MSAGLTKNKHAGILIRDIHPLELGIYPHLHAPAGVDSRDFAGLEL